MSRWLLVALTSALVVATACASTHAGYYEAPARLPKITKVIMPDVPLVHGQQVDFAVDWTEGRDPFMVTWSFGGGASTQEVVAGALERTNDVSVMLQNETAAPMQYTGLVSVMDYAGKEARENFTYTVQPSL